MSGRAGLVNQRLSDVVNMPVGLPPAFTDRRGHALDIINPVMWELTKI
jgi:hypothetical protein